MYYSHPVGKVVFSPISQQMSEPGLRTNAYLENELWGTSPPLIVLDPRYSVPWKWQLSVCENHGL